MYYFEKVFKLLCSVKNHRTSSGSSTDDVTLDPYNGDLTMIVKHDGLRGESMIEDGICSLWSGIRGTHGINQGRIAFQIKVLNYE